MQQDHLEGKSHLKNFNNYSARRLDYEQLNISTPAPKVDNILCSLSVDERIEKAWNHYAICGNNYISWGGGGLSDNGLH